MPDPERPALQVVPDDAPEAAPMPTPPPPSQASQPLATIGEQAGNYARLVVQIKSNHRLNEATSLRIVELAINERITLIQMGLIRSAPIGQNEDPDGDDSHTG